MTAVERKPTSVERAIYSLIGRHSNRMWAELIVQEISRECDLEEDAVVCKLGRMVKSGLLLACINTRQQSVILSRPQRKIECDI